MNKRQEALDRIKIALDYAFRAFNDLDYTPIDTLQELINEVSYLEKRSIELEARATPKKPNGDNFYTLCPNCNQGGHDIQYFCSHCGQAIDWIEKEEV